MRQHEAIVFKVLSQIEQECDEEQGTYTKSFDVNKDEQVVLA